MTLQQFLNRLEKQETALSSQEKARVVLFWLAFHSQNYHDDFLEEILIKILRPVKNLKKPFLDQMRAMDCTLEWSKFSDFYDSETQKELSSTLLIAFLSSLTGEPNNHDFARWIHDVSRNMHGSQELADIILGWRINSSNEEYAQVVNQLLIQWQNGTDLEQFLVGHIQQAARYNSLDFLNIRSELQKNILKLQTSLKQIDIKVIALDHIEQYLNESQFRLAVMGEFKRGKSSFINVLLETKNLTPVDDLPCTSSLIEFHYAPEFIFQKQEKTGFITHSYKEYQESVSQASQNHSSKSQDIEATKISFWKVSCPSTFLKDSSLTLIDTPGLGEDVSRDIISKNEAKRTDLAVIVFDPEQLVSLIELELIKDMGAYAKDLFVVVNKSDRITDNRQRERKLEYIITRLNQATGTDFTNRVYCISAKQVQQDIENNITSKWTEEFDLLRVGLKEHLQHRIGSLKLEQIRGKIQYLSKEMSFQMDNHLKNLTHLFNNWRTAENQKLKSENLKIQATRDMDSATHTIKDFADHASKKLFADFKENAIPKAIQHLKTQESQWTLKNSVFSPQKLAKEIGEIAQKEFLECVASWSEKEAAEIVVQEITNSFEKVQESTPELQNYLSSQGYDATATIQAIQNRTIEKSFGTTIDLNTAEVAIKGTLGTILAVVLSYIIADVILYYWLSLISGFLHPGLLVATIVLSIPVVFFGQEKLKEHLKGKIINEINKKMLKDDMVSQKLQEGLNEAMKKIFDGLAKSFEREVEKMIYEIDYNYRKSCQLVEDSIKKLGENPALIEEKLNKIQKEHHHAKTIVANMQKIVGLNKQ